MKKIVILLSGILLFTGCMMTKYDGFISKDEFKNVTKEYNLKTLKGKTIKVTGNRGFIDIKAKEFQNQIVLVVFWATWCPPCITEIPHFVAIIDKYKGKLNIVGALVKSNKDEKALKKIVNDFKINYPVTVGKENDSFVKNFSDGKVPFVVLYDQNGNYIDNYMGYVDQQMLEKAIEKAIKVK